LGEPFRKFVESNLSHNLVLITCGLPATGKTRATEEVSRIKEYPAIRTDLIRRELLRNEDIFDVSAASNMDKRLLVYDEVFHQAVNTLARTDSVIIDATFITQSLRRRAAAIAAQHNKTLVILQTECPQEISMSRILKRTREDSESNALTEQAYLNNKDKFEKVDLEDLHMLHPGLSILHIIVDTQKDQPEDWYISGIEKI
jgi:predicted kinase